MLFDLGAFMYQLTKSVILGMAMWNSWTNLAVLKVRFLSSAELMWGQPVHKSAARGTHGVWLHELLLVSVVGILFLSQNANRRSSGKRALNIPREKR